jgi:hypothetical protein
MSTTVNITYDSVKQFSKSINKAKAAAIALYKITEILTMTKKKPFEDGNVIKGCLIVAGDSLLNEFKSKT